MKKHQAIGLIIISLGISLFIISFILVPFINSERIWRSSGECYIPEGCGGDSVTIPDNILIQNKYDIKVMNTFYLIIISGSIRFTHLATSTRYYFYYNFMRGESMVTFTMIPGEYSIQGDIDNIICEIWEHGLIPTGFEWGAYLGFGLVSLVIINAGVKKFQGIEREYEIEDD
ncbi:MAG: hypothetical protein JSV62_15380 [Promethearchaeota archaeon]|nr:MAG: hypothetical protein JSV62_15380 [Candidatus Lokiarchaeota archaeon]